VIRARDFGPSFVFELSESAVDKSLYRSLLEKTLAPYVLGRMQVDLQTDGLYSRGTMSQTLNAPPYSHPGDLYLNIKVLGHAAHSSQPLSAQRTFRELYGQLSNQADLQYIIVQAFRTRPNPPMLALTSRQITPETLLRRRETFLEILKAWISGLRPHFVWGEGEFATLKKYEAEDSRLRVWGYAFYSAHLVDAIGHDRFAALVSTGKWSSEDIAEGILLTGLPDCLAVDGGGKQQVMKILRLKESLSPILPPKPPPSNLDSRQPPPKGVVE
jgi:hypothetical protein